MCLAGMYLIHLLPVSNSRRFSLQSFKSLRETSALNCMIPAVDMLSSAYTTCAAQVLESEMPNNGAWNESLEVWSDCATSSVIGEDSPRTSCRVSDCWNHGLHGGTGVPVSQCSPTGEDG